MNADIRTVLSLCAGYGGLDLGFHRAFPGAHTVCYVENEIPAAAILAHNIKKGQLDAAPIWSDLKTFDPRPFRGRVDAILGGYPCQPFSVAGQRRGTEDPRHLWPYIARIVDAIRPRICVFENVRGHVRLGLSEVLGELGRLGYRVRAGIFSAAEVGAPHRRERVFIMAYSSGGETWERIGAEFQETQSRGKAGDSSPRAGSPDRLEHTARLTEREQDDETSTKSRQDAREMSGGRRSSRADSISERLQGYAGDGAGSHEPGRVAQGQDGPIGAGSVLDDSSGERSGRGRDQALARENDERQAAHEKLQAPGPCAGAGGVAWPARPGEPQHEWEEPRTVDRKLNPSWVAQLMGLPSDWVEVEGLTREMKLRALGNGVVPQQAELAIKRGGPWKE